MTYLEAFLALQYDEKERIPIRLKGSSIFGNEREVPSVPENIPTITDKPYHHPLWENIAFPQFKRNIVYADPGVGKSLLTAEIGRSREIKCPLYFIADDDSGTQLPIYKSVLGEKGLLIPLSTLQAKKVEIEEKRKNTLMPDLLLECQPSYKFVQNAQERVLKRNGIEPNIAEKVDTLLSIDSIVDEAVKERGVDFVCLDSLNAIAGDPKRLNRNFIHRVAKIGSKYSITLLVVHHTNKIGDMAGSSAIREIFDHVYRLSVDNSIMVGENEAQLVLDEEKARFSKPKTLFIRRKFVDDMRAEYKLFDVHDYHLGERNAPKNLLEGIISVLHTHSLETMEFEELVANLGWNPPPTEGAVKNCLKSLEKTGKVQKTNGRWAVITII
jgi:hypothetical protein